MNSIATPRYRPFTNPSISSFSIGLLLAVWLPLQALAQTAGVISGAITDPQGSFVQGAAVRVEGTSLSTATDRAGRFRLEGVPAGPQQVTVDYLGYDRISEAVTVNSGEESKVSIGLRSDVVVMDKFVVESIRQGQSRAINQQRTSKTISSIISSDAIGNLPDRTVGEALARLAGVNVVDDSYANIRGMPAEHNSVTLDGDRFTTAGDSAESTQVQTDNRAVDLSLIPAEMVGGIEVIKALTADMDADSFGGTINLVTRSAFDLKERSINGKFEYIYNDYKNKDGWAGSLSYIDVLNKARTLGVGATFTYRAEDRMTESYEFSYYDAAQIPIGTSGSGTAGAIAAVGNEGVTDYDTRLNFEEIIRIGGTLNFDWKASDTTELHLRTFFEDTEKNGGRFRNRARALSRWDATSTAQRQSGQQVRLQNAHEDGTRKQDMLRLGVEGETQLKNGALEYGVRYGDSNLTASRERYIFDFRGNTERRKYSWTLDRTNPVLPVFTMTHIATGGNGLFTDLTDRRLSAVRFHTGRDDENDLSANLDYAFEQSLGERNISWKVGAKYRSKERSSRPLVQDFSAGAATAPSYANFSVSFEPRDLLEGSLATMGPYVSLREVINHYQANPGNFSAAPGEEILRLEARKYDVAEDILAGYAMATTKFDKLEVIAGLRWEQTETSYDWLADPAGASQGTSRYSDLYPSVILNYRFNPHFVARLAYTNTLSRPSYGDLVPYRVPGNDTQAESGTGGVDPDDFPQANKVFLGNANLKAQQSENFDLSLEYYIRPAGLFSVALFRKELSNVIFRGQFIDPNIPNTIFFQERNGSSGKVDGLEVSWQQSLTFLPSPLDGFGVNLNASFINGSSVLEDLVPGTTTTYRPFVVDFLPEQPETVYNAQIWWEKYGFVARVAMNHIDSFVRTSGGLTSFSINNKATRWDASLSYRVSEKLTIYLEGRNLTEEVTSWYATTPNRPEDYTFTGAVYTGGFKFRF